MRPPLPPLRPITFALALAAALSVGPAMAASNEPALAYTVTRHDTLIGLGRSLLVDPAAWPEVARLSGLRDPNHIVPGQRLQVPLRLLRSAQVPARIVSLEGDVRLGAIAARAGDAVLPGQVLSTTAESSAVLQLGDGSRVKLTPVSEMALDEHRRFDMRPNAVTRDRAAATPAALGAPIPPGASWAAGDEGLFAASMRLVRGSIEILATKVLRARPLEVTTPTAVIGVRGTDYRVHHADPDSATEVLEGKVRADAVGAAGVDVPGGFGAALRNGAPPEVVALAAAPDLSAVPDRFERPVVRFAVPGEALPLHLQVASDAAFDHVLRDERMAAGAEVRIAGLADGPWFLRARRVAANGVEGFDSQRAFSLKARPEPPAAMAPAPRAKVSAGRVELTWAQNTEATSSRVEVARDKAFTDVITHLDGLHGASAETTLAEPGTYHWRLASARGDADLGPWGDPQSFEVRPLPQAPSGGLSADGKSLELAWSARPEDHQQVELARDDQFTQTIAQAELTEAHWAAPTPDQPGSVFFRYRSVEPDGFVTPWSSTLKIEVPRDWRFLWLLLPVVFAL
jgi:hypothetical protein